jgi:hypothetical protein
MRRPAFAPELSFEGYSESQVGYHNYLLISAGLAEGADATSYGSEGPEALLTHLTWAGHDFAEAAQDDNRWKRAMKIVGEKGGTVTLDILKQVLAGLVRGSFGL